MCHDALLQDCGLVPPPRETSESPGSRRRLLIGSAITVLVGGGIAAYSFIHALPGPFWQDVLAESGWKPIPAESIINTQGSLKAGNFYYTEAKGTHHGSIFGAGDTIRFKFIVKGAAVDSMGVGNIRNETTLLNAKGETDTGPITTEFHSKLTEKEPIQFTFQLPLADAAPPGDYLFSITLFDAVSGSRLEFTQPMRIENASHIP